MAEVEKRDLVEGEEMNLLNTITDVCPQCPKKSFHTVTFCDPGKLNIPTRAMIEGSPLDVVLFERVVPREVPVTNEETGKEETKVIQDKFFVFFRCDEPMCLLNHLRENMMVNWVNAESMRQKEAFDQMMLKVSQDRYPSRTGRRANRRRKAKEKAQKKAQKKVQKKTQPTT